MTWGAWFDALKEHPAQKGEREMRMAMMSDLCKLARIAFSSPCDCDDGASVLYGGDERKSVPDALLGRGSLTVSSGRVTTSRDLRRMKLRVRAHDFRI